MKIKSIFILFLFCLFNCHSGPAPASLFKVGYLPLVSGKKEVPVLKKQLEAFRAGKPVSLDGKLDEKAWTEAPAADSFIVLNTGCKQAASVKTSAKVLYDDRNIYIGFRCDEPDIENIVAEHKKAGDRVWCDDCIQLWIDSNMDTESAYFIALNNIGTSSGLRLEKKPGAKMSYSKWDPGIQAKTSKAADCWTAEIAIPFASLNIEDPDCISEIGANLARQRKTSNVQELSSWNGYFAEPLEKFGVLKLAVPPIKTKIVKWTAYSGENILSVSLKNNTSKALETSVVLDVNGLGKSVKKLNLAPEKAKTVGIPYNLGKAGSECVLSLSAYLGKDRIFLKKFSGKVKEPLLLRIPKRQLYIGESDDSELCGSIIISQSEDSLKNIVLKLELKEDEKIIGETVLKNLKSPHLDFKCDVSGIADERNYTVVAILMEKGKKLFEKSMDFEMISSPF